MNQKEKTNQQILQEQIKYYKSICPNYDELISIIKKQSGTRTPEQAQHVLNRSLMFN